MDERERDELDRTDRVERGDFRRFVLQELRDLNRKTDRLVEAFDGSGKEPGLRMQMDRLERADKRRNKIEWAVVLTVVVWLTGQIIKQLSHT